MSKNDVVKDVILKMEEEIIHIEKDIETVNKRKERARQNRILTIK
jgi:hypothetical protein